MRNDGKVSTSFDLIQRGDVVCEVRLNFLVFRGGGGVLTFIGDGSRLMGGGEKQRS